MLSHQDKFTMKHWKQLSQKCINANNILMLIIFPKQNNVNNISNQVCVYVIAVGNGQWM